MSQEAKTVEVFLVMNEDGETAVSFDGFVEAKESLDENYGGYAVRSVKLVVTMKPPVVAEVTVTVPDEEEGEVTAESSND
jgi:hypothetical protein